MYCLKVYLAYFWQTLADCSISVRKLNICVWYLLKHYSGILSVVPKSYLLFNVKTLLDVLFHLYHTLVAFFFLHPFEFNVIRGSLRNLIAGCQGQVLFTFLFFHQKRNDEKKVFSCFSGEEMSLSAVRFRDKTRLFLCGHCGTVSEVREAAECGWVCPLQHLCTNRHGRVRRQREGCELLLGVVLRLYRRLLTKKGMHLLYG